MRKLRLAVTLTAGVSAALAGRVVAQKATLSADDIQTALAVGTKAKGRPQGLVLRDSSTGLINAIANTDTNPTIVEQGTAGFWLEAYTPTTWIQQQASNAAKESRTLTPADVGPELSEPVFRVVAYPDLPNSNLAKDVAHASSVQSVVLRDEAKKIVIQPISKEAFTKAAPNVLVKDSFGGLTAKFPIDALKEIRGPKGEFIITIIGARGAEKDFKVKEKHFKGLL
jgi:hypothetical protein